MIETKQERKHIKRYNIKKILTKKCKIRTQKSDTTEIWKTKRTYKEYTIEVKQGDKKQNMTK